MPPYRPLQERFNEKYIPEPMSGCWLWTGALRPAGRNHQVNYGMMLLPRSRKGRSAHRISWELHCGGVPEGMNVLHKCDVPLCVNPDHLFLGTHSENMKDCVAKGRKNAPSGANHWRHKGKKQ